MEYIISEHQNGLMYAYHKKCFWFWDKDQNKWVYSNFAAQRYEKALSKDSELTPEIFMDSGHFYRCEEYEVPLQRRTALEALAADDCKVAGAELPVDAGTTAMQAAAEDAGTEMAVAAEATPAAAFDYSGRTPAPPSVCGTWPGGPWKQSSGMCLT